MSELIEELEGKEMELRASKRFNKAAGALIIIMLIIMGLMVNNLSYWADQYEELAGRYEVLYEELKGGEEQ